MTAASLLPALLTGLPAMLRAAGAAVMAPAFTAMPVGLRVTLAVGAAGVAWPLGSGMAAPKGAWWSWAPVELLAGVCIGAVAAASVEALRLTGRLAGEQMGLAIGETYGPAGADAEGSACETAMGWAAAAAFVAVGGVESTVLAAVRSVPGDGRAWLASTDGIGRTLDAAMGVGLRVCLPVLAVTLAGAAVGGVIVRAVPRLAVIGGGFGARAAMAMGVLASSAGAAWALQGSLARSVLDRLVAGGAG